MSIHRCLLQLPYIICRLLSLECGGMTSGVSERSAGPSARQSAAPQWREFVDRSLPFSPPFSENP